MTQPFRGLTWDHPRGYNALAAAAKCSCSEEPPLIVWEKQPLEGFESHPIADLAARYDLLVLDHPHIGEAVAEACLTPLEGLFSEAEIQVWRDQTIGPALRSYRWAGRHWALPLDVATQVTAYRADLLGGEAPPPTWEAVVRLSERYPVALSAAGPHAVLNLISLCVALGDEPGGEDFVGERAAQEALAILRAIAHRAPKRTKTLNPIAILELMATDDVVALVPLVYGYVNYAIGGDGRRRVSFADAPTAANRNVHGSVLGGTGIALTRRTPADGRLLDHLRWLMHPDRQANFIPAHDGQPSARAAWTAKRVDRDAGGFYSATRATVECAYLRPRYDGYVSFQTEASDIVRRALFDGLSDIETLRQLRRAWRAGRESARGPLA